MKIIFLGTNGWYDTKTGSTPCILIDSKKCYLVLDAGNGIYKLDRHIKENKPIYLFLSHFHIDHIEGLHILPKFKFQQGLKIFVQDKGKKVIENILNHPYTMPLKDLPYEVEIIEMTEGKHDNYVRVECRRLNHIDPDFGYRFELDSKVIAYSGDTGITENSFMISKDADLLIHESTLPSGMFSPKWGHTNSLEAAELAKKSNVKKLVLTHFQSNLFLTLEVRKQEENKARKIFKNTFAAKDGMVINL